MVTKEEGLAFAEESGCLFVESSAKTRENVEKCFEELALKVCLEKYIMHCNVIHLKPFFLLRGQGGGR
jgi:GTPase SAR1 family protein